MNDGLYDEEARQSRISDYKHKAKVLRQIHSNKLAGRSKSNAILNYSTIFASAFVTFFAFFGVDKIHELFLQGRLDLKILAFVFNIFILVLLIISFLQITLRLGEQALRHLSSVQMLTEFITDLDDLKIMKNVHASQSERQIERLNDRYKSIIRVLPANSDSEWRRAKAALGIKERRK